MVEEERAEKQSYLYEEIINKGHDPDAFMAFCEQRKGADIDNWTIPELRQCVTDFQNSLNPPPVHTLNPHIANPAPTALPPEHKPAPNNPESEHKVSEPTLSPNNPESEYKVSDPPPLEEKKLEDRFVINCVKYEPNELSSAKSVVFEILEPILVKGGFFSSDYYLFPARTLPLGWECRRKFSEYLWLREMLTITLIGIYIPPIPSRKSRQGSPETILNKKRKIISKFTSGLARNSLILSSPIVEGFFRITDTREFSEFQKKVKKQYKKPENPEQLISPTGTAQCDISFPGTRPEKLLDYTTTTESLEKKLKRHATAVMNDIKLVESEFSGLSELINNLAELQDMLPYGQGLMRLYLALGESMKNLGEQEKDRYETFEEYFNMYFKYTYLEKEVMKNMLKERESAHNEYVSAELKKKNVEKARNFYGFLNYLTINEVERVIAENSMLMNKHFIELAQKEIQSTTSLHSLWTKLIESIDAIKN